MQVELVHRSLALQKWISPVLFLRYARRILSRWYLSTTWWVWYYSLLIAATRRRPSSATGEEMRRLVVWAPFGAGRLVGILRLPTGMPQLHWTPHCWQSRPRLQELEYGASYGPTPPNSAPPGQRELENLRRRFGGGARLARGPMEGCWEMGGVPRGSSLQGQVNAKRGSHNPLGPHAAAAIPS